MFQFRSLTKGLSTTSHAAIAAGCTVAAMAVLMTLVSPAANASVWDKRTTVDFQQPVEVPGAVLPPGKYVMKLVDIASARNIVQITNERENHVYSTSFTIPVYRSEPFDKTVFTFYEAPAGQPEALKTWFYPGDETGRQFVYPKGPGVHLAALTGQTAPAEPFADHTPEQNAFSNNDSAKDNTPPAAQSAPASESAASAPPVTIAQAAPAAAVSADPYPQAPQPEGAPTQASGTSSAANQTLPKTASPLPSLALLGLTAIGGALGFRRFRHRAEAGGTSVG